MEFAKIQFELRFSPILNFSTIYREIISPFLKLASGFQINNQGGGNEGIMLLFQEDYFQIDCRWDRLILISEGDTSRFTDKNSSIKYFFELFETFNKLNSFGKLTHYILLVNGINLQEATSDKIIAEFESNYLNKQSIKNIISGNKVDDIMITLEFKNSSENISLSFGPFSENTDVEKRSLYPFKTAIYDKVKNKNGIMSEIKIIELVQTVDKNKLLKALETCETYHKKIAL